MKSIPILSIDEQGRIYADVDAAPSSMVTLPVVDGVLADRITILPNIPRVGTPAFDAWLRGWHMVNNPQVIAR